MSSLQQDQIQISVSPSLFGNDQSPTLVKLLSTPPTASTLILNGDVIHLGNAPLQQLRYKLQENTHGALTGIWEWRNAAKKLQLRLEATCREPDTDSAGVDLDAKSFWFMASRRFVHVVHGKKHQRLEDSIAQLKLSIQPGDPKSPVTIAIG
jgi:hypothetical protein